MFGLVLTFVACLGGAPDRCQNISIPFDGTTMQCALFGQQLASQWLSARPGWQLKRGYRCETGERT